ncbi:hypothetical protein MPL3356_110417 [Mesorhizobium plurifarium]|uniref:Uncharacterized protein n=1 Tax=Mesorhizobium plurifarium TaxID=69974 RepID=A0A090EYV1_MESPL|nr:hypothetical protein MPL3356_110417 [Mesorhizobium plurifarium]
MKQFSHSAGDNSSTTEPRASHGPLIVRSAFARRIAWSFENAFSIELRSGLYGGSNLSVAPACSIASRIADDIIMETFDHLRSEEFSGCSARWAALGKLSISAITIAKVVIPDLMIHELG